MIIRVELACFLCMMCRVEVMAVRDMGVVCRLFHIFRFVMFGGAAVMFGGLFMVMGGFFVMVRELRRFMHDELLFQAQW